MAFSGRIGGLTVRPSARVTQTRGALRASNKPAEDPMLKAVGSSFRPSSPPMGEIFLEKTDGATIAMRVPKPEGLVIPRGFVRIGNDHERFHITILRPPEMAEIVEARMKGVRIPVAKSDKRKKIRRELLAETLAFVARQPKLEPPRYVSLERATGHGDEEGRIAYFLRAEWPHMDIWRKILNSAGVIKGSLFEKTFLFHVTLCVHPKNVYNKSDSEVLVDLTK